ncbi:hypothetical protein phiOC_p141 [Ochrobactrum phage vB_OspM_OC]|nr:hypothetical protein phiOC_p141 [Ochrobactrum phage vB_OspM_OC]
MLTYKRFSYKKNINWYIDYETSFYCNTYDPITGYSNVEHLECSTQHETLSKLKIIKTRILSPCAKDRFYWAGNIVTLFDNNHTTDILMFSALTGEKVEHAYSRETPEKVYFWLKDKHGLPLD